MIYGFNTDVVHDGVVYHVQTEDMGEKAAQIVSLVYRRGEILANKRTGYEDLLGKDFDESVLAERLQRQHKLICAAIVAGRIEDLKRLNNTATASATTDAPSNGASKKKSKFASKKDATLAVNETQSQAETTLSNAPINNAATVEIAPTNFISESSSLNDLILDLPPPPVATQALNQTPARTVVRSIAPGIADFARTEERADAISLNLIDETELRAGRTIDLRVSVTEGEAAAANAEVKIKILGTNFRPVLFSIKTDGNGIAAQQLTLPMFKTGRAALLITATVGNYEAELRRIISQAE